VATALVNLGILLARGQGGYDQAVELATEGLNLFALLDARREVSDSLEALAEVASAQGKPARAARLYGTAEALRSLVSVELAPDERAAFQEHVNRVRAQADAASFEASWAEGRVIAEQLVQAYRWEPQAEQEETTAEPDETAAEEPAAPAPAE
jgi:hypothetical protein